MNEEETTVLNLLKDKLEEAMKQIPNPASLHPSGMQMWLNALQTGNDVQFKLSAAENGSIHITLMQPDQQGSSQDSTTTKHDAATKNLPENNSKEQEVSEDPSKLEEWGLFHNKKGQIVAQPIKTTASSNKFKWSFDGDEISLFADDNDKTPDLKILNNAKQDVSDTLETADNEDKATDPQILVSITTDENVSVGTLYPNRSQVDASCEDTDEDRRVVDPSSYPCVREEWYIKLPQEPARNLVDDMCEVDTACVAFDMRNYLRHSSISLRNFSRNYLQRTQGTLSDLLNHPKPWQDLSTRGRTMYTKMMEFLNAENIREITEKLKDGYTSVRRGPTILTLPKELMEILEAGKMPSDQFVDSLAANFQIDPEQLLDYCEQQIGKYAADGEKEVKSPATKKPKKSGSAGSSTSSPKQRKHICPEPGCGIILGCRVALSTHMLVHTSSRPFKCSTCDKRFATISNKRSHERRHEKRTHRKISKRALLVASLRQQSKEPHAGKNSDSPEQEKSEVALCPSTKVQSEFLRYVCGVCSQRFSTRPSLHDHITLRHTSAKMRDLNKAYTCHVCLRSMKTVAALLVHLRTHSGDRPYRCASCQKTFGTKANLGRHLKTHTGEKPFECETCGARFTEASSVVTHMRTHTGEKPYECEICEKRFTQRGPLDAHRRIHSDLRPYLCEICGLSFRQKTNLRAHELRHVGERRFQCNSCPQKFQYKNDLTRHVLTHSGERPHACDLCPLTFTRAQYLREHVQRAHDPNAFHCENCGQGWANRTALERHRAVCPATLASRKCESCGLECDSEASFERHRATCGARDVVNDQSKPVDESKLSLTGSDETNMEYAPSMLQVLPVHKIMGDGVLEEGKTYLLSAIPQESDDSSLTNPMCCISPLSPRDAVSGMDVTPSISSAMSTETDPSLSATNVTSSFAMTSGDNVPIHVAIMNNIDPSLLDGTQVLGGQQDDGRMPYIAKIALQGNPGEGESCSIDPNMQSVIIADDGDDVGTATRYVVVSVSDDVAAYSADSA